MAVHIRLARAGSRKVPFYRIVAADQRAPREAGDAVSVGPGFPWRGWVLLAVSRVGSAQEEEERGST